MPDGVSTYLDQFRLLVCNVSKEYFFQILEYKEVANIWQVTHMGNALGFVRMVRSGGLRATASAIRLIQLSVMIL